MTGNSGHIGGGREGQDEINKIAIPPSILFVFFGTEELSVERFPKPGFRVEILSVEHTGCL